MTRQDILDRIAYLEQLEAELEASLQETRRLLEQSLSIQPPRPDPCRVVPLRSAKS